MATVNRSALGGTHADSKARIWAGRVLSALPIAMLLASATFKFIQPEGFAEGIEKLGWPVRYMVGLGILELVCTIIYAIPQTAVLGAILLTGYLGGAIATHVRLGEAFYMQAGLGILVWLGLYLREPRLRTILPVRL